MNDFTTNFFTILTTPLQYAWILIFGIAMFLHPLYTLFMAERAIALLTKLTDKENQNV
jgi:hypothetical protein